jgi:uncharacterized protein (TIGR03118 family)
MRSHRRRTSRAAVAAWTFALSSVVGARCFAGTAYVEHVLVSDGVVNAPTIDSDLINPWGASQSQVPGFIWVSDQGTDKSTLYDGAGKKNSLIVDIPFTAKPGGEHGPTGQVFNSTQSFTVSSNVKSAPSAFIFANLDGSISAWNPTVEATKAVKVFTSPTDAGYTGLTVHTGAGGNRLYAIDGLNGKIDVLDDTFTKITPSGGFKDPSVPSGLFPFNASVINDKVYVTYAQLGENAEVSKGLGALAVFDLDGNLVKHLSSGGDLTSPWGLTMAPANFGDFSNKLLVGNFSEDFGEVNAFDPATGAFLGTLKDKNGNVIKNPYLWSVIVGNGGAGTDPDSLYITAGPQDESRGVFASIGVDTDGGGGGNAVPLPPALAAAPVAGVFALVGAWRARRTMRAN